jgi:hypothetical protein
MAERELIIRIDGLGVDDDTGMILVYRVGDQVSLVATAENNGDAEIVLDKAATAKLAQALKEIS